MTDAAVNTDKPSPRAKSAARLYAVQAVYQLLMSGGIPDAVVDDFLVYRVGSEPEMADVSAPARDLFRNIVSGAMRQRGELEPVVGNHLKNGATTAKMAENEPLLFAILLCGAYELMAHVDIDAPIIISDYLNVTHSYYPGKEPMMINGILDALKALYRSV